MESPLTHEVEISRSTLLAVASTIPSGPELKPFLDDTKAAQAQGYFLPDEDERLREQFAQYLEQREALREIVAAIEPWVARGDDLDRHDQLSMFSIGFLASCLLIKSGLFLIELAEGGRVVRSKLDEPEPRLGIPRKAFTSLYRRQTSVRRMWRFHEAWRFYEAHRSEILALRSDDSLCPVVETLLVEEP